MRTYVPKEGEITREWVVMDAADQVLGRLATKVARILRGKHKPDFTPYLDTGDFVVIVNAERVRLTGAKLDDKVYYRHSGRPGSLKSETARERLDKYPERVIQAAVWGMLPKNRLGRKLLRKLKVYAGPEHPHDAQQPKTLTL
ncbi:MAG: 50S ribosomal protein L13 [Acidobacteria bacterium]|uniref:Large ribosomal subunit protein uL13 n=1 Tax=Candidatus Sulfomarinibacter kjeldsenii TaxID=2885994 RepID=A0A8J7CMT4_9BACT|nr:50S ribosomal protein L13 [Candidatus Sulfomarinibacter kjeldsenii]MBD3869808.1 50S ribosomal protein L13 [Candidatus Sulfomarinibacter kjeldsenii]